MSNDAREAAWQAYMHDDSPLPDGKVIGDERTAFDAGYDAAQAALAQAKTGVDEAELHALELEFPDVGLTRHTIHRLIQAVREAREQGARAMQEAVLDITEIRANQFMEGQELSPLIRELDPAQVAKGGERE